jgi:hypothetical protein
LLSNMKGLLWFLYSNPFFIILASLTLDKQYGLLYYNSVIYNAVT